MADAITAMATEEQVKAVKEKNSNTKVEQKAAVKADTKEAPKGNSVKLKNGTVIQNN